jgi:hypothetical protein
MAWSGKNVISFSNEAELGDFIRAILRDVFNGLGMRQLLSLSYETALGPDKGNVWVVRTKSGVPISVIEAKLPSPGKLSNDKLLGQVFDYLSNLRNNFGQCEVFGILTTLEHWRVCWLPDSDSFAASIEKNPKQAPDLTSAFPVKTTLNRVLSASRIYDMNDPHLLKVIGTVLTKSLESQYRRVSLLSPLRSYVALHRDFWTWEATTEKSLQSHPLTLRLPVEQQELELKVLRWFNGGADGQVCLALTSSNQLVVVKRFHEDDKCLKEFNLWKTVNGVGVLQIQLVNSQCLIMPFVFQCVETEKGIEFNFDLSSWGKEKGSAFEDDASFDVWTTKINDFMKTRQLTAETTLVEAVDGLVSKLYVHRDLDWRHVGLLPQLSFSDENQSEEIIIGMKPVLIDLSSVELLESQELAWQEMQPQVEELSRNATSSSFRNVDTKQKEKRHFKDEDASETTSGEMEQKKVEEEPEAKKIRKEFEKEEKEEEKSA